MQSLSSKAGMKTHLLCTIPKCQAKKIESNRKNYDHFASLKTDWNNLFEWNNSTLIKSSPYVSPI